MQTLKVPFKEKDKAKAMGAYWDAVKKVWYIPDDFSSDKSVFTTWIVSDEIENNAKQTTTSTSTQTFSQKDTKEDVEEDNILLKNSFSNFVAKTNLGENIDFDAFSSTNTFGDRENKDKQPISLLSLLQKIKLIMEGSFSTSVACIAEVANISNKNGNYYFELIQTDNKGTRLAQTRATLWRNIASSEISKFKQITGSDITLGCELLLKVKVSFHEKWGFALNIAEIDPSFTLGALAKNLALLQQRLKKEGVYDKNKQFPTPIDFAKVAVLSPAQAAGLADFMSDAKGLANICEFHYFTSTFQGDSVQSGFKAAFEAINQLENLDAVLVIRGGGAKLDLAELNQYDLALCIANCKFPVFTAIGHQIDRTILDEIACQSFDTPSKSIAYIRETAVSNAKRAKSNWQNINNKVNNLLLNNQHLLYKHVQNINNMTNKRVTFYKATTEEAKAKIKFLSLNHLANFKKDLGNLNNLMRTSSFDKLTLIKSKLNSHYQKINQYAQTGLKYYKQNLNFHFKLINLSHPKMQQKRGFALVENEAGEIVKANTILTSGDNLRIKMFKKQLKVTYQSAAAVD